METLNQPATSPKVVAQKAQLKTKTMFESLLAIQQELQTIAKDKKAFKGSYATIENVWESIRKTINGNGFVVYHEMAPAGILTVALHQSGEKLSSCIPFIETTILKDSQDLGKEITYAKRYNLNAIFNIIVADEDNDATKQIGNYKKSAIDGKLAADKLTKSKTRDEALKIYKGLSEAERNTTEVVAATAEIKNKFDENN